MEIQNRVIHVTVSLAQLKPARTAGMRISCRNSDRGVKISHKSKLSLNIPSQSSPRIKKLKENIQAEEKRGKEEKREGTKKISGGENGQNKGKKVENLAGVARKGIFTVPGRGLGRRNPTTCRSERGERFDFKCVMMKGGKNGEAGLRLE
jgi:hypothetical protein